MSFQQNKLAKVASQLSMRNFYSNPDSKEFKELRVIYNKLWKNLDLPQDLKPRLQYQAMLSDMGFSPSTYTIYVNKHLSPFKMNLRNKTGKNEANLRHEIEHVKQIWDVVRLLGIEDSVKLFQNSTMTIKITPCFLKKMKEILSTLEPISSQSEGGIKAQLYVDAIRNYSNPNKILDPIEETAAYFRYRNNLLEKKAREAAKNYQPSIINTIKTMVKEFFNLFFNQN